MSSKNSAATAAQQGLDDLMAMDDAAAASEAPKQADLTASAASSDDELEGMSGDRVARYYTHRFKPGSKPKDNQKLISAGQTFLGTYIGSFVSEKSRYKSRTHKIKLLGAQDGLNDGDIIGLPSCGILDIRFQYVPEGTKAQVTYGGQNVMKGGDFEGSDSYVYDVKISKSVNAKIKARETSANYELKKKSKS